MSKVRFLLITVAVLALAVFLSSCFMFFPSLQPFYTEEDIVFNEDLLGKWVIDRPGSEEFTLIFRKKTDSNYAVESLSYMKNGLFEAHLFELGDKHYLDLYPEMSRDINDFYAFHFVPAHTIMQCRLEGDELRLNPLNPGSFGELIESGELRSLRYERFHYEEGKADGIVLTSSTEELRELIMNYADILFPAEDAGILKREQ